jgi:hypothetical protein
MFESRYLMTGFGRASAFLFVVLALASSVGATTVPDSRGAWTKALVPMELRSRVHASAREVPAFPDEDPRLMSLKNWPKKREIEGWDCELRVGSWTVDTPQPPSRPGLSKQTGASYICRRRWWPWGKSELRGPSYVWTSDGQLLERGYSRSRRDYVVYKVDRTGRLVGYDDKRNGTEEYFDADGVLIGGEYVPVNLDWRSEGYRGGTVRVWLGERVSQEEFVRRLGKFCRDVGSRY